MPYSSASVVACSGCWDWPIPAALPRRFVCKAPLFQWEFIFVRHYVRMWFTSCMIVRFRLGPVIIVLTGGGEGGEGMRCRHDRWTTRNDEGGLGRAKTPKASVGSIWEYKVDDDDSGVGPLDDRGACTPAAGVVEAGNIDALSTYPLLTLCGA
jgi:hypothetical protein